MGKWTIEETDQGLRLAPLRALGFDHFTWAHLLYGRLSPVQVYVLYFPSRFDLPMDTYVIDTLRTFGTNTGAGTSVNIWDSRDSNVGEEALMVYEQALQLAPDDSSTHAGKGEALTGLQHYKEALLCVNTLFS